VFVVNHFRYGFHATSRKILYSSRGRGRRSSGEHPTAMDIS